MVVHENEVRIKVMKLDTAAQQRCDIGALAGLGPPWRAMHMRDAHGGIAGVHASHIFFNDLVPRNRNHTGRGNQLGHGLS